VRISFLDDVWAPIPVDIADICAGDRLRPGPFGDDAVRIDVEVVDLLFSAGDGTAIVDLVATITIEIGNARARDTTVDGLRKARKSERSRLAA
jgi:hypothetical protein